MKMPRELVATSRFLSLVLRHQPDAIGLHLDANGWADVAELLALAARHGRPIPREMLDRAVAENDKQRFAFNDDRTKIRASQGHSVEIELGLEPSEPPEVLYHGTATHSLASIREQGLSSMSRRHVHLSLDQANMLAVGSRHGKPVLLTVRSGDMARAGHRFYLSANGVWLTDAVPPEFIAFPEAVQ